jgi:hypothetical protein
LGVTGESRSRTWRGLDGTAARADTYDNFTRDFGERFVPGYKRPSAVDYLLNSPFKE